MDIFPAIQPELYVREDNDTDNVCIDVKWENGEPVIQNGNPVFTEGTEAVRSWAERCLAVLKGAHVTQSISYGTIFEDLLGSPLSHDTIESEARQTVIDALTYNSFVESVEDLNVEIQDGKMVVSCKIITALGEEVEVVV